MSTSSPEVAASATRERRSRAARLLADASRRADLEWADLAHLPDWAHRPVDELDQLAWAAAAWLHAHELRRCIDGPVLSLLRTRLGKTAFAVLMSAALPADAAGHHQPALHLAAMPVSQIDTLLLSLGRDCLLASVEPPALRRCLREHWWPTARGPVQAPSAAVARAAVQAAMVHGHHAGPVTSSSVSAP